MVRRARPAVISRGDIWWVDLGEPRGSGPSLRRPAVVVSSDRFNASRIATVIVAPVTSNLRRGSAPGNVVLPDSLLPKPSVVDVSHLVAVDRGSLIEQVASVPALELHAIDAGLRLLLAV